MYLFICGFIIGSVAQTVVTVYCTTVCGHLGLEDRKYLQQITAPWRYIPLHNQQVWIKVTVSLLAEHFPFVAYVLWMTTGLYCRTIHKFCSRTDRRYDISTVHTAVGRTEHCCDSSLVVIAQHCVVLCCVVLCCVATEKYSNKLVTDD